MRGAVSLLVLAACGRVGFETSQTGELPGPDGGVIAGCIRSLDADDDHVCALTTTGVVCWGRNSGGQLGDGTLTSRGSPAVATAFPRNVDELAVGGYHTCVRIGERVQCIGSGYIGQLGDGTMDGSSTTPRDVLLPPVARIVAGQEYNCALTIDRRVYCWGNNNSGQLGDGTLQPRTTPVEVPEAAGAEQIAAASEHTCALRQGSVLCWGFNDAGQLGDGTTLQFTSPVGVAGISTAVEIGVGSRHSCARLADGTLRCWGANYSGQLGDGSQTPTSGSPPVKPLLADMVQLASGFHHQCALERSGALHCWGGNTWGQTGVGTVGGDIIVPFVVSLGSPTRFVAVARRYGCALGMDGTVRCWGANQNGELGDGTISDRTTPGPTSNLCFP